VNACRWAMGQAIAGVLTLVLTVGYLSADDRAGALAFRAGVGAGPGGRQAGHPYPRGDEWPGGLPGSFERQPPFRARVASFDGVELDGWIQLPRLPEGVRAPVVLVSSPYYGQTVGTADVDEAITPRWLVERGYAVAAFNVRGTGESGGCLEFFGPNEQRDQAVLVEWLGAQAWSNGRVGMYGLSYMGTTPWEAAIQNPPALKTIVVAGMVADAYNFFYTPQGAAFTVGPAFAAEVVALVSNKKATCPAMPDWVTAVAQGNQSDFRDPAVWQPRRLADRFPEITSSVFLTHGFQDLWGSGHGHQEDHAWAMLRAPKRMMIGQWGHEFPPLASWNATLVEWLDFWLKGTGAGPPGLGAVDVQDGSGGWHRTSAWPPTETRQEVLYLDRAGLSPVPGGATSAFRSAPSAPAPADQQGRPAGLLCAPATGPSPPPALLFTSPPLPAELRLAGNPFAFLQLDADAPGGLVTLHLLALDPDFSCQAGSPHGFRFLSYGSADLRFHAGNYEGRDFPIGSPTDVRIDVANLAEVLAPGQRLAALVSFGDPQERTAQPYFPVVELRGDSTNRASHLVVPVVSGTLAGEAPSLDYPPSPFPGADDHAGGR
jgi:predicted acyl esterase